jgi:TetR/AcrR family transcriptional regulator, ethionamide resistance regulator
MNNRRPMRVNLEARAAIAEQRRARTRERLLDAAEAVVAQRGFESASIEEFVSAAGVSRGTFYNYFPTATELLHALNTRVAEDLDRRLERVTTPIEDCAERLAATLHTVIANYMSDPVRGWIGVHLAGSRAPRQQAFETRFAAIFREGVACGRFRDVDMAAAYTIAFGSVRMAQRDMLGGSASPEQGVMTVALILAAYGVSFEDAEPISRREAAAAHRR